VTKIQIQICHTPLHWPALSGGEPRKATEYTYPPEPLQSVCSANNVAYFRESRL